MVSVCSEFSVFSPSAMNDHHEQVPALCGPPCHTNMLLCLFCRYRVLAIGDEKDRVRKEDELNR